MNARGFTLLEVLVALAILGIAVVASIQGFAQGLRLLKLAGDHQNAMLVADEKLREVVLLQEGKDEGAADRFRWKRTIARVPIELKDTTRAVTWGVFQIDVHVQWDEHREIHLATRRTVPNVAAMQQAGTTTRPTSTTQPPPAAAPVPR